MSILIKCMEMPESCDDCEFIQHGIPNDWCYITEEDIPCDCPLVEIPDNHGDLIDRDLLIKSFCGHCCDNYKTRCNEPCYELRLIMMNSDAVIPADREGE